MVQKFTLKARSEMYEDVNGDYVSYEDYEKLKQEFMDYVYNAEKTKESLMRQVDEAIRSAKR